MNILGFPDNRNEGWEIPVKEVFVGFDSAWAGNKNGAICYAVFAGGSLLRVGLPQVSDFFDAAQVIKDLQSECDDMLVAIDQPIVVPKHCPSRPVDLVARSFMSRLTSAAQSASRNRTAMFGNEAPIWKFIRKIGPSEYVGKTTDSEENRNFVDFEAARVATGGKTRVIEVYPAMALPALESEFMQRRRNKRRYTARYDPTRVSYCEVE